MKPTIFYSWSALPGLLLILVSFNLSSCVNVYGPASLGVNTHVVNKPFVAEGEKLDTAGTYARLGYSTTSFTSDNTDGEINDYVHTLSGSVYRSYIRKYVSYSFGGGFAFGKRTFPQISPEDAIPVFNHHSFTLFGEVSLPPIQGSSTNFYPVKLGMFYTYEGGESMDYLDRDFTTLSSQVYRNPHMPALVLSHGLLIQANDEFIIGLDLGSIYTFSRKDNSEELSRNTISTTFFSLRAGFHMTVQRYTFSLNGVTGLHGGAQFAVGAKLGKY